MGWVLRRLEQGRAQRTQNVARPTLAFSTGAARRETNRARNRRGGTLPERHAVVGYLTTHALDGYYAHECLSSQTPFARTSPGPLAALAAGASCRDGLRRVHRDAADGDLAPAGVLSPHRKASQLHGDRSHFAPRRVACAQSQPRTLLVAAGGDNGAGSLG